MGALVLGPAASQGSGGAPGGRDALLPLHLWQLRLVSLGTRLKIVWCFFIHTHTGTLALKHHGVLGRLWRAWRQGWGIVMCMAWLCLVDMSATYAAATLATTSDLPPRVIRFLQVCCARGCVHSCVCARLPVCVVCVCIACVRVCICVIMRVLYYTHTMCVVCCCVSFLQVRGFETLFLCLGSSLTADWYPCQRCAA